MKHQIQNPILPGFYPDPSICRVGEDYYLVTSTFELFPGLPIFHSRDLANWEQIGYAMDRPEQLIVQVNTLSGGVMAPTIRYHEGTFYIINANFCDRGNYIITATDPKGPWSQPHYLDDVPGIDASLFFDNDGKCYVLGTGNVVERPGGAMERGIWVAEYDIENFRVVGEPWTLWDCALRVASSPEAPHLYHIGDYYYLLIAEGGTEHYHCCAVARSKELRSFFDGYKGNPILTHRNFGFEAQIANVGHGDWVDTPDGNWYMVFLASRQFPGNHKNLGRETYIVPVIWDREWPVCAPDTGKVEWRYPADEKLPWTPVDPEEGFDDFDGDRLGLPWNLWGTPSQDFWKLADGKLELKLLPNSVCHPLKTAREGSRYVPDNDVSVVFRRQRHTSFRITAKLRFHATAENEAAGIVMMQGNNNQLRVERTMDAAGRQIVRFVKVSTWMSGMPHMPDFRYKTTEEVVAETPCGDTAVLRITGRIEDGSAACDVDGTGMAPLGTHVDIGDLNPESMGCMVGTMLGMYATSNGAQSENTAAFEWFHYEGWDE